MYPVTAEPPSDAGAVKVTVACSEPGLAETPVGAPGTPRIATLDEAVATPTNAVPSPYSTT